MGRIVRHGSRFPIQYPFWALTHYMRIIVNWFNQLLKFDKSVRDYLDEHRVEWENKTGFRRAFTRVRVELAAWWNATSFFRHWRDIE